MNNPIIIGILFGLITSFLSFLYCKYILRSALLKQGIHIIIHYLFILLLVAILFFIRRTLHLLQIYDHKDFLVAVYCWAPFLVFWVVRMYIIASRLRLPNPTKR
jgi:hypothetical protein